MRLIDATLDDVEAVIAQELSRHHSKLRRKDHPASKEKLWLSNSEAMEYLGLSRSTMQRYRDAEMLPFARLGSNIYYRRQDIEDLLESRLRNPRGIALAPKSGDER